jgi:hypothetical protein
MQIDCLLYVFSQTQYYQCDSALDMTFVSKKLIRANPTLPGMLLKISLTTARPRKSLCRKCDDFLRFLPLVL